MGVGCVDRDVCCGGRGCAHSWSEQSGTCARVGTSHVDGPRNPKPHLGVWHLGASKQTPERLAPSHFFFF